MKMIGVGSICERHSEGNTEETQLCRFPEATGSLCHQCGKTRPNYVCPHPTLANSIGFCSKECEAAWEAEHPGYWTPIEETLPGGRYDGVWENSGLAISFNGEMKRDEQD